MPYRLAYLVSHPIQYQAPLLRFLAAQPDLDVTTLFLSDMSIREYRDPGFGINIHWDVPLLGGYRHEFLPVVGRRDRITSCRPWVIGLRDRLQAGGFDVLWVHGYAHQAMIRAILVARKLGIPVLLRGESHLQSSEYGRVGGWIKEALLPVVFRLIDGFLAIGSMNRSYYRHYGVPERRIFWTPYAVDNEFFSRRAIESRGSRDMLKRDLGFEPGRPVILFAAKLVPWKRPGDLLEAYARLSPDRRREPLPYLLIVGDGPQREWLEARARTLGWRTVKFVGFRNQIDLPRFYDLADVFVLPSAREPWGLAVNEVMNAGKPVVISDRVGAGFDLVRDGLNGFTIPVGDIGMLAERLRVLTSQQPLCRRMGEESAKRIRAWNFEADLEGLRSALGAVVGCGK